MTVWVQDPYSQAKPVISGSNIYVKENPANVEFDLTVISGLVAGVYGNATVTVDNKGRVTAIQTGTGGGGGGGTEIIISSGTSLDINPGIISARISLKSNVYFSDTEVYSGTNLYYVPYYGNNIPLYNTGTGLWETNSLNSQLTYNLAGLRSGTNFDVFVFKSGTSTMYLELVQWTNDTTRVDVTTVSGVPVKTGSLNKRLVGSIRTTGTGMSDDGNIRRFLSNLYNRKKLKLYKKESTDTWTYNSSTWRYVNNDSSNKVELINCTSDIYLQITASLLAQRSSNGTAVTGIGVNTIASETSDIQDGVYLETIANALKTRAELNHYPSLGLSYYAWMEKRISGGGDMIFGGDAGDETQFKSAIFGTVEM